ncbi:hypothetical protein D3C72_744420 [compost metagenome]
MSSISFTMSPMRSELSPRPWMTVTTSPITTLMRPIPAMVWSTARLPPWAAVLAASATWLACKTLPATCWMVAAISPMLALVWVTAELKDSALPATWVMLTAICSMLAEVSSTLLASVSALPATCLMLAAISSIEAEVWVTAAPVSSAALATEWAASRTVATTVLRPVSIEATARPSWSRSPFGLTRWVRSPWLRASATEATSLR